MGYAIDQDYTVTIDSAACVESQAGNSGFELRLSGAEGSIKHTIYITANNIEMAQRQLKACGLDEKQMGSAQLWDDPGSLLVGTVVSIRTKEEVDRQGRALTKVAWINSASKAASADAKAKARALLSGSPAPAAAPKPNAHGTAISNDDVPF